MKISFARPFAFADSRAFAFAFALSIAGCRTPPLSAPSTDLSPTAVDLATLPDLTVVGCPEGPCSDSEVCVYFERGDCSRSGCVALPSECSGDPSCACLGDAFCAALAMNGEQLTCVPSADGLPPRVVTCMSTILCI